MQLAQYREGVDRSGEAGEGDELEQGFIQAHGTGPGPQRGEKLAPQRPPPSERGGDRDAGEA